MSKFLIDQNGRRKIYEILDGEFTIGSGRDADLILVDADVAAAHARVKRTRDGFRIIDLETRTGTNVGGRPVNNHLLVDGDVVEIGSVRLTYEGPGPVRPEAPAPPRPAEPRRVSPSRPIVRRRALGDRIGASGRFLAFLGVAGLAAAIAWFVYSGANAPSAVAKERLRLARRAVDQVTAGTAKEARAKLDAAARIVEDDEDRAAVRDLDRRLSRSESEYLRAEKCAQAADLAAEIRAARKRSPVRDVDLAAMSRRFLSLYDDLEMPEEIEVREVIAELERAPRASDLAVAETLRAAEEFIAAEEFKKAMAIVERADEAMRAAYSQTLDAEKKKILALSRSAVEKKIDDVARRISEGAVEIAEREIRGMPDKFVWSTMDAAIEAQPATDRDRSRSEAIDRLRSVLTERRARQ